MRLVLINDDYAPTSIQLWGIVRDDSVNLS